MKKTRVFSVTEYAERALQRAEYFRDENGVVIGKVPGAQGFYAQGANFEEARTNLRDVIEGNIVLALQLDHAEGLGKGQGKEGNLMTSASCSTFTSTLTLTSSSIEGPFPGGRHRRMVDPKTGRVVPIPFHKGQDVSVGLICEIITELGITRDDWLNL
jgi:predicted RNase H-like HicB family nuclease